MAADMPVTELHAGFSSPEATPTDWAEGRRHIDEPEAFLALNGASRWSTARHPVAGRVARRRNVLLRGFGRAEGTRGHVVWSRRRDPCG